MMNVCNMCFMWVRLLVIDVANSKPPYIHVRCKKSKVVIANL